MKKNTIIIITACLVGLLLILGTVLVVNNQSNATKKLQAEQAVDRRLENKRDLDLCLDAAKSAYDSSFKTESEKQGTSGTLTPDLADRMDAAYKENKDTCFRKYPLN